MNFDTLEILLALPAFALVVFRLSGLMLTAPLLGSSVVPLRLRVAMTLVTAAMIFPLVRGQAPAQLSLSTVLIGGVGELMIGILIGLSLAVLMMGAEVGGLIVGRQAGLALGNIFDPLQNQQASIVGQVYTICLTVIFLMVGGHRATMAALLDTYYTIPLLSFQFDETFVVLLVQMLGSAFILGIRLAGPVLVALFLVGTALGFLSRTMPQLNILTVGFTVRAMVALGVAAAAISASDDLLVNAIRDGIELVRSTFGLNPDPVGLVI